ncbi:MAG TPA: hypothetical protein VFU21_32465 [Kofleriaceae bacterium]|nr:hypothetical protein [Kofleriaceae bacterium]
MRVPKRAENVQTDKQTTSSEPLIQRNRSVRILAKSIFRELKQQGYDDKQIVALATELLSEVTDQVRPAARSG